MNQEPKPNYIVGDYYLVPEEPGLPPVLVGHEDYVLKHKPVAGGYYVVYEDGYKSFSPAAAFESGYAKFATPNPEIQVPATIGTPFEGGFYGGKIKIGLAICAIVWAPKAEGEIIGKWLNSCTDVPGATSCFDSMANTKAMAEAGSVIAQKALAANIAGHTDWCVPARDVLEMGYRYLKPTTQESYCSFRDGDNASSIPAGYPYTADNPAQTTAESFQEGNAEAFETDRYYFSSTQSSELTAFAQYFSSGYQSYGSLKNDERRCRFVRLIPLNS